MKEYYPVLSIAGSDCSGGAGIQADIKTISALGGYAASAITAVTVQNTCGVRNVFPIPAQIVEEQIAAVMDDIHPLAVKIGMVNQASVIHAIARSLRHYRPRYVVLDPVMVSTSGHRLMEDSAVEVLTNELMPLATLITPNLSEAETLCGQRCQTIADRIAAARHLLGYGSKAVLVKGGHDCVEMTDVLYVKDTDRHHLFTAEKVESRNTHGTGCTLSSAIATFLAQGMGLIDAVEHAKLYVTKGIQAGSDVTTGAGHGALNHFFSPIAMKTKG